MVMSSSTIREEHHKHRYQRALRVGACSTFSPIEHRPPWPTRQAQDDVAPEKGSPTARSMTTRSCSAGSRRLVLAEIGNGPLAVPLCGRIQAEPHVTTCRANGEGFRGREAEKPARRREGFAAATCPTSRIFIPTEHHNPMSCSPPRHVGRTQAHGLRQDEGRQNVQRYLCGVFDQTAG